jgi:hypothetical protein
VQRLHIAASRVYEEGITICVYIYVFSPVTRQHNVVKTNTTRENLVYSLESINLWRLSLSGRGGERQYG